MKRTPEVGAVAGRSRRLSASNFFILIVCVCMCVCACVFVCVFVCEYVCARLRVCVRVRFRGVCLAAMGTPDAHIPLGASVGGAEAGDEDEAAGGAFPRSASICS